MSASSELLAALLLYLPGPGFDLKPNSQAGNSRLQIEHEQIKMQVAS
jgi:hypothetical protein